MEHPTLEEVKEYFKNAKKVKCLWNKQKVNITKKIIKEAYKNCSGDVWIVIDGHTGGGVLLYNETTSEYAEILTYKEKTFSITESQIKELCHSSLYSNTERLKKMFPEAFESEVKLEVGKWLKHKEGALIFRTGQKSGYGFNHKGNYEDESCSWSFISAPQNWEEATEQEVFEALRVEALKRYKVGDWVKSFFHNGNPVLCISETDFGLNVQKGINCKGTTPKMPVVYSNGQWAEIIQTITLSEAERQLGKKIIV